MESIFADGWLRTLVAQMRTCEAATEVAPLFPRPS